MSDETLVEKPGGRMTRDDLVQRLVDLQREIGSTANGAHCYGVWARRIGEIIAALATPPAALPADLVALAQQWRDRARRLLREADRLKTSTGYAQRLAAEAEGLDRAADQLSALLVAPRVPDTPQCVIGVYCQRHGFMHGQEAEELREHLEALSLPAVNRVLDEVDARDSLAYLEATNEPTPPDVAPPQEPPR